MDARSRSHEIPRPRLGEQRITPPVAVEAAPWPGASRPLSDIREITEPSLIDGPARRRSSVQLQQKRSVSTTRSKHNESIRRKDSARRRPTPPKLNLTQSHSCEVVTSSSSYSPSPKQSDFYAIPLSSVPQRSSSHDHTGRPPRGHVRKASIHSVDQAAAVTQSGYTVPNRGQSRSPVKEAAQLDSVAADRSRRVPSWTHIRMPHPSDILEFPSFKHPRIRLELQVSASLFVGGGTVEGYVKLTVDENERLKHRRPLKIGTIAVDLLGYEVVVGNRKAIFLALGTDLIDVHNPPPPKMTEPPNPLVADDMFWTLKPSVSSLPFMISLPLDTGPPPFQSRQASIRYSLCATAIINDAGKLYRVRTCQDAHVLPTYDPEKALRSLPSPLTASDELPTPRVGSYESVKVTAGLHRQVWVSGNSIFVDVHIANKSRKPVKRLDLSLERDILIYKHAAAGTREKSTFQARVFESNNQNTIAASSLRMGTNGWSGVEPHDSFMRTCELDLPRGHATVKCGKYFEVRYFLTVAVSLSNSRLVSVQLPIILIYMNSLDAVPNCVAQVAAAMEEKRVARHRRYSSEIRRHRRVPSHQSSISSPAREKNLRRRPSYSQGRAFAVPRQQYLDRQRAQRADLDDLGLALDSSPRKHQPQPQPQQQNAHWRGVALKKVGSNMSFGNVSLCGKGLQSMPSKTLLRVPSQPMQSSSGHDRRYDASAEQRDGSNAFRDRLHKMQSFDSIRSKHSASSARYRKFSTTTRDQNTKLSVQRMPSVSQHQQQLAPHTLGLSTTSAAKPGLSGSAARPTTATGFRDELDRSRFEFKAVRRKGSERSIKEHGMLWWEQLRSREKEREGWI